MKQILFLLLFPCLALAQYTGNAGQKITLGEQTTADGLVFRGVANIDTLSATSKITRTNKQDTSAFLLLDTVTNLLWHYKTASNGWTQAGGSTFDTTTLNLVSRFALKLNIADTSNIKYVNTYGIQTVNGAKTFTTAPTFSTALLGGSGGTGITSFGAVNRIPYASSTTALTTSSNLTFDETVLLLTKNSSGATFATLPNISVENTNTSSNSYSSIVVKAGNSAVIGDILADGFGNIIAGGAVLFRTVTNHPFLLQTNATTRIIIGASGNITISNLAGTGSRAVLADVNGVLSAPVSSITNKENVQTLNYGLNEILQINPVSFDYINKDKWGDERNLGFIVEDMFPVIPEVTGTMNNGDMYLDMTKLIPILTKAIQEQQAFIKALEQRIINLENK